MSSKTSSTPSVAGSSARIRFIVKQVGEGRGAVWRVYDVARGSFPYRMPDLGVVAQDHPSETAAQAEADRLSASHGWPVPTQARARAEAS